MNKILDIPVSIKGDWRSQAAELGAQHAKGEPTSALRVAQKTYEKLVGRVLLDHELRILAAEVLKQCESLKTESLKVHSEK